MPNWPQTLPLRRIYAEGPHGLSAEERERLIRRHGDFGKIALAFGVPANEEPRKSIEASAQLSFLAAAAVTGVMLGLGAASIVCIIAGVVLLVRKKLHPAYVPVPPGDVILLDAFAVYLIVFVGFGSIVRFFELRSLAWNWLVAILIALPLVLDQEAWRNAPVCLAKHRLESRTGMAERNCSRTDGLSCRHGPHSAGSAHYFLPGAAGRRHVGHPIMTPLLYGGAWEILGLYGLA